MNRTFDPGFGTDAMESVFDDEARVRRMLEVEAAVARALAAEEIMPAAIADEIASVCATIDLDATSILSTGWEAGTPVIPLLGAVRGRLTPEAANWLHHGVTTQDIVDTAQMLQARQGCAILESELRAIAATLGRLAAHHRATPALGRTFLQPAAPTTFGMRAAQWLEPVIVHVADLHRTSRDLPVQLGGPVGDLASLGDAATRIVDRLADGLELTSPPLAWHSDRSPVATLVALVERIARSMAKVGVDLALLAQHGEITVRAGTSSSLPHKRNPIDAVRAVAAAEACSGAASVVTRGRPVELDRGLGGWHAEWWAVPAVFHTAAAAVSSIGRSIDTIEVDPERMAANLAAAALPHPSSESGAFIDRVLAHLDRISGA